MKQMKLSYSRILPQHKEDQHACIVRWQQWTARMPFRCRPEKTDTSSTHLIHCCLRQAGGHAPHQLLQRSQQRSPYAACDVDVDVPDGGPPGERLGDSSNVKGMLLRGRHAHKAVEEGEAVGAGHAADARKVDHAASTGAGTAACEVAIAAVGGMLLLRITGKLALIVLLQHLARHLPQKGHAPRQDAAL